MKEKINLHIYPSPFKNESRILKETKSVIETGVANRIIIVATYLKGLERHQLIDDHRTVFRIKTIFDFLSKNIVTDMARFIAFQTVIFFRFLPKKITYINCHSLSVLPVGVLLKAFKKTKLIYDTHELETERAGLTGFKQKLSKLLEKSLFGYIDSTIVVSNSINKWYRDAYRNDKIYSVRNIPDLRGKNGFTKQSLLKERFCIRNDELLYIYQGLLSRGRGIEILLEVFSDSQITAHVVFMGYGNYEAKIREYSGKHKNIHFIEAVPPDEIIKYSSSADIGICLIENIGLSYYYCLPNKVFEYTLAGIPVIVSNFPDLSEYIQNINGGWKINPNTNELKELISTLSYVDVNNMKLKLLGIEKKIGWEFEEEELKKAYL